MHATAGRETYTKNAAVPSMKNGSSGKHAVPPKPLADRSSSTGENLIVGWSSENRGRREDASSRSSSRGEPPGASAAGRASGRAAPRRPKKNARFHTSVRYVRIRGIWQYTPEEMANVWYSQEEYDDMRLSMRKAVKKLRKRIARMEKESISSSDAAQACLIEMESDTFSTRGLEHLVSSEVLEQHREEYDILKKTILRT